MCVRVLERADGTKAIQATFSADFFYYWGAAWYAEGTCIFGCHMFGRFYLHRQADGYSADGGFDETLKGNSATATHTFEVDSGHYKVTAGVSKEGGYWRNQGQGDSSGLVMNDLQVEVGVP